MNASWRGSRREFVRLAGVTAAALAAARVEPALSAPAETPPSTAVSTRDPDAILRGLLEGNQRFVSGQPSSPRRRPEDFAALAAGQTPLAVIVGCADSRVPPELLFDQGVGDLFVVRVAGNVVTNAGVIVKGSIEYAVAELSVPLIMVLGHSNCGAIKAALKHIMASDSVPGSIKGLVDTLRPTVAKVKGMPGDPLDNATRANVAAGVERLKALEPILAGRVTQGRVKVVGGLYDLKSGSVAVIA